MKKSTISSIKTKSVHGISVLMIREVLIKVFSIVGQLLIVRLLVPEYFGVFAILSFIVSTAELFTDLGFSLSLIQTIKPPTDKQLSTAFYIKMFLSILSLITIITFSPILPHIFTVLKGEHIPLLIALSIILLFKPYRFINTSLLERELKFKAVSLIDIVGIVIYYIAAVIFAYFNFSIWALVVASLLKEAVEVVTVSYLRPWKPMWYFDIKQIKELVRVGAYFQLGAITSFIFKSTIPVIGGVRASAREVGLLDWSNNIASIPRSLSDNLGRVSFAAFSKIQNERKLIAISIEKAFGISSIPTLLLITLTFAFGQEGIHFILSDKWVEAYKSLMWLLLTAFFLNGTALLGHAIMALGKSKLMFYCSIFLIISEWMLSITLFNAVGYVGIAIASCINTFIMLMVWIVVCYQLDIVFNLRKLLFNKVLILILSSFSLLILNGLFPKHILLLIPKLIIGSGIYISIYYLLEKEYVLESFQILKSKDIKKLL